MNICIDCGIGISPKAKRCRKCNMNSPIQQNKHLDIMRSPEVRANISEKVTISHRNRQIKNLKGIKCNYEKNEPIARELGKKLIKNRGIHNVSELETKIICIINDLGVTCKQSYMPKEINYIYDGYIPEFKTLIEVDGKYWHSEEVKRQSCNLNSELKKTNLAYAAGYSLIRFREKDLPINEKDLKLYIKIVLSNNQINYIST